MKSQKEQIKKFNRRSRYLRSKAVNLLKRAGRYDLSNKPCQYSDILTSLEEYQEL